MYKRKFFPPKKFERKPRTNEQIRIPEVSLIDDKGVSLGTVETREALRMAREAGLDLVEISPQARPPVAKIMDFGKYMYDKSRKEKGKKSAPAQEMKTVRIGLYTGEHDLQVKAGQVDRFLKKGHPVRVEMFLRGREKRLRDEAIQRTKMFPNYVSESHTLDGDVKPTPRGFNILLRPSK